MDQRLIWTVCCGLMALGLSPPTLYRFAPAPQTFAGSGEMRFAAGRLGLDCRAAFAGITDSAGAARIDRVTFSGGLLGYCANVRPIGLPWPVRAAAPNLAYVSTVHVEAPVAGDCLGHDIPASVDGKGVIRLARTMLSPGCAITGGELTTTPGVSIIEVK